VVAVKLTRCRRSNCGETALGAACEHGPVWHVGEARDRQRPRPHCVCDIAARRRLRCDAGAAAVAVDIDRNATPQDGERHRRGLGGLRGCRRTVRSNLAGEHRPDRDQRRAPHPGLGCDDGAMILPAFATALAYVAVILCPARSMPLRRVVSHRPQSAETAIRPSCKRPAACN